MLNCKESHEKNVIAELWAIDDVKDIQCVSGPYDILVKVDSSTAEKLHETITWKIRKLKNVRSTYALKINEETTDYKNDS